MQISSGQCKNINYSKKEVGKPSIFLKKKDTSCEVKNSDVPPTNCSLIQQQRKLYSGVAANDADSVEKIRFPKTHEIKGNLEKHMPIHKPKKEASFSSY